VTHKIEMPWGSSEGQKILSKRMANYRKKEGLESLNDSETSLRVGKGKEKEKVRISMKMRN